MKSRRVSYLFGLCVMGAVLTLSSCTSKEEQQKRQEELESMQTQASVLAQENESMKEAIQEAMETTTPPEVQVEREDAPIAWGENTASPAAMGDVCMLNGWEITVTGVRFASRLEDSYIYYEASSGKTFCVVDLSLKNLTNEEDNFIPMMGYEDDFFAVLKYGGEEEQPVQLLGASISGINPLISEYIKPLVSVQGNLIFEISSDAESTDQPLEIEFSLNNDKLVVPLR